MPYRNVIQRLNFVLFLLAAHSPVPPSARWESEMIERDDYRLNEFTRTACSVWDSWTNIFWINSLKWFDSKELPALPDASFALQGAWNIFDRALSHCIMASDEPKAKRIKLEEKQLRYSKHKHRFMSVDS